MAVRQKVKATLTVEHPDGAEETWVVFIDEMLVTTDHVDRNKMSRVVLEGDAFLQGWSIPYYWEPLGAPGSWRRRY